jgi:transposase
MSKQGAASAQEQGGGDDPDPGVHRTKGIGGRTRFGRTLRRRLGGWAFHQLGFYIGYKAERAGVPVVEVNPRSTSRECPECGHIDKRNRRTQAVFQCRGCGHTGHADCVAAENIRRRGERQLARSCGKRSELALAA